LRAEIPHRRGLSLDLVEVARVRGFAESNHVVWLGKAGSKDWELKALILNGDWTFVMRNSVDFRGPAERPGTRGQYADVALHAGLICINSPAGINLEIQRELFSAVLDEIGTAGDLVNEVIEADLDSAGTGLTIHRYPLPQASE
jgi:hypothetical protein